MPGRRAASVEWPRDLLDVAELQAGGWRPVPIRQFVVKIHSRCNLACDYCYVYEMGDQTWRDQPRVMPPAVIDAVVRRIAEHAATHRLARVHVVLHGGEPLLAGKETLCSFAAALRRAVAPPTQVVVTIQTNAVQLDESFLRALVSHDIGVSVSFDGTAGSDHRRFAGGAPSGPAVVRALRLLGEFRFRRIFRGILSTISLDTDPAATFDELAAFGAPRIDFLLPHGNWTTPPPGHGGDGRVVPYGSWLARAFDRWYDARPCPTDVRLFSEIINLLLGGQSRSESLGLTPVDLVVVETNGALEQVDTLKSSYPGAAATGLTVTGHSFDDVLAHPGIAARQLGVAALAPVCQDCRVRDVCGGGYYPHRYRAGSGFRNPSVYCADLLALIEHVRGRVAQDLRAAPPAVGR
ncbi:MULTISPECIES: FxsB family cyclophane-forming radical SAM/SPASM peptide maturase [Pseudofrankia]|uniref:FxsB family cyclophane-forming radical SAM/SPASM peptide maturase n=1 Tax=Pseudofrankia TaxID=2994363 RepID=UPI000234CB98|nr:MULTISPECIES: FxsB family cyclophane-forming radical SAM/SPASM peptide maturase [Pseudofrankia]OHV41293.1 radical SAM protein [Pseudofrankia sp. EUN1h]